MAAGSTAGAAELDGGCRGAGASVADGSRLDVAQAPGPGGNDRDHPFVVDYDGVVVYGGRSPQVFHNHSWHVDLYGMSVKSGGSENGDDERRTEGQADVSDYLPFDAPGLYYVSGGISADEGSCSGNVWVKIEGSPVGTIPWIAGVVFTAGGVLLLIFARPTVRV
jgi:hypothetical protein